MRSAPRCVGRLAERLPDANSGGGDGGGLRLQPLAADACPPRFSGADAEGGLSLINNKVVLERDLAKPFTLRRRRFYLRVREMAEPAD